MKPNSRNPLNPFAQAVNEIEEQDLQLFLNFFANHIHENGGGFHTLLSITLGYGMADVYRYISHEIDANNIPANIFDYFNVAPLFSAPLASDTGNHASMDSTAPDDDTLLTCADHGDDGQYDAAMNQVVTVGSEENNATLENLPSYISYELISFQASKIFF